MDKFDLPEDAKLYLETAISLQPNFPEAHFARGNIFLKEGNLHDAVESYLKAIKHRPGYAKAYSNLGDAYTLLKRYPEAIASAEQALKFNSTLQKPKENIQAVIKILANQYSDNKIDELYNNREKTAWTKQQTLKLMLKYMDPRNVFDNIARSILNVNSELWELTESDEITGAVIMDLHILGELKSFKTFLKDVYKKELAYKGDEISLRPISATD